MQSFTKRAVEGGWVIVCQGRIQTQYAKAGEKGVIPSESQADKYLAAAAETAKLFAK